MGLIPARSPAPVKLVRKESLALAEDALELKSVHILSTRTRHFFNNLEGKIILPGCSVGQVAA